VLFIGSDAVFGGRKDYFKSHGDYKIWDYNTAIEKEKIPKDYHVWWGFEDKKLYEFAKEELIDLANQDKPFNFTMLTVDTHHVGGYVCDLCENEYEDQYANVIACADRQVYEFVRWIQSQDFYENTTIIISGDHDSMDPNFFDNIPNDYVRSVFNVIINSPIQPVQMKNRLFTVFDMYPTTLASLGYKIEGEKLALGTNLFSSEKTLLDIVGKNEIYPELENNSLYYNKHILYSKK
jgi:phosphoglycerol transferase